jgi:hypothetical protein
MKRTRGTIHHQNASFFPFRWPAATHTSCHPFAQRFLSSCGGVFAQPLQWEDVLGQTDTIVGAIVG